MEKFYLQNFHDVKEGIIPANNNSYFIKRKILIQNFERHFRLRNKLINNLYIINYIL